VTIKVSWIELGHDGAFLVARLRSKLREKVTSRTRERGERRKERDAYFLDGGKK